jgi:hypothetical protein
LSSRWNPEYSAPTETNTSRGRYGRKLDKPAADTSIAAATVGPAQQRADPKAAVMAPPTEARNRLDTVMQASDPAESVDRGI